MNEQVRSGSRRIFIVDDDDAGRESTVERLQLAGYAVSEATDPDDALRRLATGGVSLLILDLGLPAPGRREPVRPGLHLLDRVAELPPMIVVSGSGRPPLMDPRTSAFLGKPVAPQRLLAEVERIIGVGGRPYPMNVVVHRISLMARE